jgi:hypothetical protein
MAVVLTASLIVFADGILSLLLDREIIGEPDAGPLVGPLMAAAVCLIVLWFVLRSLPRPVPARMLAAGLSAVIGGPLVGATLYTVGRGQLGVFPFFFGSHLLDPFVLASGVIAAVVVGGADLAGRYRGPR